jgi:hypothetical protein
VRALRRCGTAWAGDGSAGARPPCRRSRSPVPDGAALGFPFRSFCDGPLRISPRANSTDDHRADPLTVASLAAGNHGSYMSSL